MIKAAPLTLRDHIRNIVKACDEDDKAIATARDATKSRLEEAQNDHGIDASAMRRLLAWRKAKAKDPAKRLMSDELDDQYRFLSEGGMGIDIPEKDDSEIERVMALTNTAKPPKIAIIRKELGCSQGKAHKLRSLAAARLAMRATIGGKSSSSSVLREHEHLPPHDTETGEVHGAELSTDAESREGVAAVDGVVSGLPAPSGSAGGSDPADGSSVAHEADAGAADRGGEGREGWREGSIAGDTRPEGTPIPADADDLVIPAFLRRVPA